MKRHAEQDMALTKFREQLLVQHSLEIEKINDRHRNEIKKYHVSDHTLFAAFESAYKIRCSRVRHRRSCKFAIKMRFRS